MEKTKKCPLVSVVLPVFNEAAILEANLHVLHDYLVALGHKFDFEMVIVNDGSTDDSGDIADRFALSHHDVRVCHHLQNFRLGQALRTGFDQCLGEYIVVLDVDLSYSPEHVERLVDKLQETRAEVVVASPYMKGGQVSNVPWLRKQLSYLANKFLAFTATRNHLCSISTLTGMVRGFDADFLRLVDLKAMDVDINTEILYKSMILRARILEIPAHLAWKPQVGTKEKRKSSFHIIKAILYSLVSGFTFRPFMFFILPGFFLFLLSLYPLFMLFVRTINKFKTHTPDYPVHFLERLSDAVGLAFVNYPQAFIVGGFGLMISIQLMSLGILALQKKKYFEELFHANSMINHKIGALLNERKIDCVPICNRCKR